MEPLILPHLPQNDPIPFVVSFPVLRSATTANPVKEGRWGKRGEREFQVYHTDTFRTGRILAHHTVAYEPSTKSQLA
jgi:hypothetical protein